MVVAGNGAKQIISTIYCLERVCGSCLFVCLFLSLFLFQHFPEAELVKSLSYMRCQKAYFISVFLGSVKTCVSKERA